MSGVLESPRKVVEFYFMTTLRTLVLELCRCVFLKAKSMEQKKVWCQEIKKLMIESCGKLVPDRAKELVLGTKNSDVRSPERASPASRDNSNAVSPSSSKSQMFDFFVNKKLSAVFLSCGV